jgi:Tol biopolymer transport system component
MRKLARFQVALLILTLLAACGQAPGAASPAAAPTLTQPAATPSAGGTPETPTNLPTARTPLPLTPTLSANDATATPYPTPAGPQARLIELINTVEALPIPGLNWRPAALDMLIYQGGQVWAKAEATARLQIGADLLRVAPNTILTVAQPEANTLQLNLEQGQVWVNIEGLEPGTTFQVETPNAVTSVRGTRFSVRLTEAGVTIVSTQVSTVTVSAAGVVVKVGPGQQSEAPAGQPPTLPHPMTPEEQLRWGLAAGPELAAILPLSSQAVNMTSSGLYFDPALSRLGNLLAYTYIDPTSEVESQDFIYDINTGQPITQPQLSEGYNFAYSPFTDTLAYNSPAGLCLLPMGGAVNCLGEGYVYDRPQWAPNTLALAVARSSQPGGGNFNLMLVKPDGPRGALTVTPLTQYATGHAWRPSWSPDGQKLAYVYSVDSATPGELYIMNADGSAPVKVYDGVLATAPEPLAWSPDGQWLAVCAPTSGLWLVPSSTGTLTSTQTSAQMLPGTGPSEYFQVTWSPTPSGWPLFFRLGKDEAGEVYYLTSAASQPAWLGTFAYGPAWSADGSRVLFKHIAAIDKAARRYQSTLFVFDMLRLTNAEP